MAWNPQQQYQRPRMGGFSFFPPAIKFLLASNVAVFLIEVLFGSFHTEGGLSLANLIEEYFSLWPLGSGLFYPWQFVSYLFLHDGFNHLFWNMFILWMFGADVENEMGTKKFVLFYLLCGLGGGAAHLILSSAMGLTQGNLIGASGAIFGVLVAFAIMYPDRSIYVYFILPVKAKYIVAVYTAYEIYMAFNAVDNVSHLAHLGGAVTGLLFILISTGGRIFSSRNRIPKNPVAWNGGAAPNGKPPANPWRGMASGMFKGARGQQSPVDAEYHDIETQNAGRTATATDVKQSRVITQEEIDRILDKIAATGYQNLTTEERDILFEASRRMEERK